MIQSGLKFAHVRTAQLLWHVQCCDLICSLFWSKKLPENYYPYPYSSKFCFSRLLFLYSFLSLSFFLTIFRFVCYCSMWLCFSQGISQVFELLWTDVELLSPVTSWRNGCPHFLYPPLNKVEGGYTGFTLSVSLSVHLWTESFLLCIFYNTQWIHLIFTHLIKQLQKVCHM